MNDDDFNTETAGGGTYFKAGENASAKAFLIEPKGTVVTQADPFKPGETRDILTADITVFRSQEDVDGKADPEVLSGVTITNKWLVADFTQKPSMLTSKNILRIAKKPARQPGFQPTIIWAPVDEETANGVKAYVRKRQADYEAALADVPEFLK